MPASRSLRLFGRDRGETIVIALTGLELASPSDAVQLRGQLMRLQKLRDLVEETPFFGPGLALTGTVSTRESLIDSLCDLDEFTSEVELPPRASLLRTFLVQESHLLRDLVLVADVLRDRNPEWAELDRRLRRELADSIYTQLGETLLCSLLADDEVPRDVKQSVAAQLVAVWERIEIGLTDFCPWLEAAWGARNRVKADLGSLLGTSEYVKLLCEDCPTVFLDYFGDDDTPDEARESFEEFLFGLSWEELGALRDAQQSDGLRPASRTWAEGVLHRPIDDEVVAQGIAPLAIHRSFERRHRAAETRRRANLPGPRHTAEAYMMVYMLRERLAGRRSFTTLLPPLR